MKIDLSYIKKDLLLEIEGDDNTLFEISDEEVMIYGEARVQIKEGCSYEYQFSDKDVWFKKGSCRNKIIRHSKFGKHKGTINPNIYVGTHSLEIDNYTTPLQIEVRSVKSVYRSDYRYMLKCITDKCTDLIMKIDSPVSQFFETDFNKNPETLYQRFSFVKSLIDSNEFEEAIQKIITSPTTYWQDSVADKDIRNMKSFDQKSVKQLVTKSNRVKIQSTNIFNIKYGLTSIPAKIESTRKIESINTPENRFVKHALEEFLFFCENCESKFEKFSNAKVESGILITKLSSLLNQSFFRSVSRPNYIKINNPVLQRKNGYREVLNAWLKFDLAAKLIWQGGDNVYKAGKKDVAVLYEYWLFFTLLEMLGEIFEIQPKNISELIQYEKGQLSLNLKQGKAIALKGVFKTAARNLNVQFSYNRPFGGGKKYPNPGSYSTTLRPDYTLSIWPEEIEESIEAEKKEMISHIHFDAKYKVNNFYELLSKSQEEELSEEENFDLIQEEIEEVEKGTFKNQDLLKMHTYKDAIRRTSGAYVLYPGEGVDEPLRGFHELIPGLGAFVIKPNSSGKDKDQLKIFIKKIIANFIDRASQREHTAVKVYDIHKNEKKDYLDDKVTPNILCEPLPEFFDKEKNEKLIPDETYILLGYCKNEVNIDWFKKEKKYVFRMDDEKGSLCLENEVVNAKYLLLREKGKSIATKLFKIKSKGPKVYKGTSLKGYQTDNLKDYYLVIEIESHESEDFNFASFNFKELEKYKEIIAKNNIISAVGIPFAVKLTELMRVKIK